MLRELDQEFLNMNPIDLEAARQTAIRAARDAGTILKDLFAKNIDIESKGNRNLLTEGDLKAEQSIISSIKKTFPDHQILCEESGSSQGESEYRWIIDPLDGTTNYAFGIPIFCTSIALTLKDEPLLGVIYDPLRDELFYAENGKGTLLNNTPVTVAKKRAHQTSITGFDLGYDDQKTRQMLALAVEQWSPERTFRLIGSAALGIAYVACGRSDMYLHGSIYPWDIAAAILMVREAGGEVTDWAGNRATVKSSCIFASATASAHPQIRTALAQLSHNQNLI